MNLEEYFREIRLFTESTLPANHDVALSFLERMLVPTREIFDPIDADNSIYSFRASESYGFSPYPCSSLGCRIEKVHELSNFAALYSNKIYIPNPFEKYLDSDQDDYDTSDFISNLIVLTELEPFARYRMLGLRNSYINLCSEHKNEIVKIEREAERKMSLSFDILRDEYLQCDARVLKHPSRGYHYIQITGDSRLIDHDAVDLLGNPADKAFERFGYSVIDKDYMVDNLMLGFIRAAAHSVVEAEMGNLFYGGSFLTSRDIEASIIDISTDLPKIEDGIQLASSLKHNVPYLENISVWKMLEFRTYEGEKFENYRDAVAKAMREYSSKDKNSSEIVSDIINPELHKIDSIMKRYKENQRKSISLDLAIGLGGVAVGLSGVVDPQLSTLFSTAGGVATLRSLGQKALDLTSPPKEAFDNDYYFLWKMNQTYNSKP